MSTEPLVALERRADGVAVVTLQHGKVNAISSAVCSQLGAIAKELHEQPPGAVVVTGGEKIFAAGADITEFGGPEEATTVTNAIHDTLDALASIPRFVIAAVAGYALGGGCELAMACDYRISSERAVYGQPEILLGTIPGGGGTQRLPRLVGPAKAKEICITGRQVTAEEAYRIGLTDEVVGHDDLHERAFALAAEVAKGAVLAQGMAKAAIDQGMSSPLDVGLGIEKDLFVESFTTEDSQVGVKSFLENGPGKAQFTGT